MDKVIKENLIKHREWMDSQVNELLAEGTEKSYRELYELLRDSENQTVISETTKLEMLRQMTDCWNAEMGTGKSNILLNVKNLEQAEEKYLSIKHGLWRIESGLSERVCRKTVYAMCQKEQSRLLIAWIIKVNIQQWENVFVLVSQYMQEYSMTAATELLSYGIMFYPGNEKLLLQKANCFMELGMWKEVLETLCLVKNPSEEVREMIGELVKALEGAESE